MKKILVFLTLVLAIFIRLSFETPEIVITEESLPDRSLPTVVPTIESYSEPQTIQVQKKIPRKIRSEALQKLDFLNLQRALAISKQKSTEAHIESTALLQAAEKLGELRQAWGEDPSLKMQALGFYSRCGSDAKIPRSLRAVCLGNEAHLSRDLGQKIPVRRSLPPSVVRLAKELAKLEAPSPQ